VCREALCSAENIIHPRLPVVGVEALSRCIADSCSRAAADSTDTEPSLFGRRIDLGHTDAELNWDDRDNVADEEIHDSSVTELCPVSAALCTVPLSAMESGHAVEHTELPADDVTCSPIEESTTEDLEMAVTRDVDIQNDVTSPACGKELEKSDSVSFVSTVSSFAVFPELSTLSRTVRENGATGGISEGPLTLPESASAVSQCSGSGVVQEQLPESYQSESHLSLRKRKYSTTSSVNDGGDSGSEDGEIEV